MVQQNEKILIVDDELNIRQILTRVLEDEGFGCDSAANGYEALAKLNEHDYALILCDVMMPGINGLELLREVDPRENDIAVIMITAGSDVETAISAMRAGAYDYILKPFNFEQIHISMEKALERRRLLLENKYYQKNLEKSVLDRTRELGLKNKQIQSLYINAIQTMIFALEAKDTYTHNHSSKVAKAAAYIAQQMTLNKDFIEEITLGALLHDVGKIGTKESILNKVGPLTPEERKHIEKHPLIGEKILKPIRELAPVIKYVKHHHEWINGNGYPDGLKGEQIAVGCRILAVADAYDALTSDRPYRKAYSHDKAMEIILEASGEQFDEEIAQVFSQAPKINNLNTINSIQKEGEKSVK